MKLQLFPLKSILRGVLLTTAGLGALAFAGAARAQANNSYDCQRRIERAEWRLEEAIEHHGYYSRQANHERHELQEERDRCWREQRRWREQERRERSDYYRDRRYYGDEDDWGYRDRN